MSGIGGTGVYTGFPGISTGTGVGGTGIINTEPSTATAPTQSVVPGAGYVTHTAGTMVLIPGLGYVS